MKYYLSICAIFRNEARYLKEWIEFHRLMGVDHFFLYNNLSEDDYFIILKEYIDQGIVTLHDWPKPWKKRTQIDSYQHCLDQHKNESQWIAFIDLDEFLFAPNAERLTDVIQEFERFPGIVVNWQIYGSSGYKKKPTGLVIENFTMKAQTNWIRNRRIKSMVNPSKVLCPVGPHFFEYEGGELAVTENFEPVSIINSWKFIGKLKKLLRLRAVMGVIPSIPLDPYVARHTSIKRVSVNQLRINHYMVKSEEETIEEIEGHSNNKHTYQMHWLKYHDRNDERDEILHRYVPTLKRVIGE